MNNTIKISPDSKMADVIEQLGSNGLIDVNVDKYTSISESNRITQTYYLSIFVWLIFHRNGINNKKYIANINTLMARIEASSDTRKSIRSMLYSDKVDSLQDIIEEMNIYLGYLEKKSLKISIVKDLIWIIQESEDWRCDIKTHKQFKEVCNALEVTDEQIDVIMDASKLDEKILAGDVSDSALKIIASELAARAASVGVPLTAVYLSGSAIGLSAAGITSGLAAWGFGGLLGLSSMATGIGLLFIVGTVTYQGLKFITEADERGKISRRELMLRQILMNHQQAIANLSEDIFAIAGDLSSLLVDVEKNKIMIAKILKHISMTQAAVLYIQDKEEDIQDKIKEENKNIL